MLQLLRMPTRSSRVPAVGVVIAASSRAIRAYSADVKDRFVALTPSTMTRGSPTGRPAQTVGELTHVTQRSQLIHVELNAELVFQREHQLQVTHGIPFRDRRRRGVRADVRDRYTEHCAHYFTQALHD